MIRASLNTAHSIMLRPVSVMVIILPRFITDSFLYFFFAAIAVAKKQFWSRLLPCPCDPISYLRRLLRASFRYNLCASFFSISLRHNICPRNNRHTPANQVPLCETVVLSSYIRSPQLMTIPLSMQSAKKCRNAFSSLPFGSSIKSLMNKARYCSLGIEEP